jgi:hypothetical protein
MLRSKKKTELNQWCNILRRCQNSFFLAKMGATSYHKERFLIKDQRELKQD